MIELKEHKNYYTEMFDRGRMMCFKYNGKLHGVVTFLIGNIDDEGLFVRENPWSLILDNPNGSMCYIDQLVTTRDHHKYSFVAWNQLKTYLIENFPNVTHVRWNRFKGGEHRVYIKCIR